MISADDVISILQIKPNMITTDEIDKYIKRYTLVIISELGDWAKKDNEILNDPLFEECLLAIIACQLTRTKIQMIHAPSEYKVGDTTLKYNNTSLGLYGNIESWCDYYRSLLSSLTTRNAQLHRIQVVRRHGMSSRPEWWHL